MTRSKRLRTYVEDELPLPGDIVELGDGEPIIRSFHDRYGRNGVIRLAHDDRALVLAVCGSSENRTSLNVLDWMLVLPLRDSRLGWTPIKRVSMLISERKT